MNFASHFPVRLCGRCLLHGTKCPGMRTGRQSESVSASCLARKAGPKGHRVLQLLLLCVVHVAYLVRIGSHRASPHWQRSCFPRVQCCLVHPVLTLTGSSLFLRSSWLLDNNDFNVVVQAARAKKAELDLDSPQPVVLGRGSYGAVYKAPSALGGGTHVAVKLLLAPSESGSFTQEVCLSVALRRHPNIVRTLGVLQWRDGASDAVCHAVVMEAVTAQSDTVRNLYQWILSRSGGQHRDGRVAGAGASADVITIARQICGALAHIHDCG